MSSRRSVLLNVALGLSGMVLGGLLVGSGFVFGPVDRPPDDSRERGKSAAERPPSGKPTLTRLMEVDEFVEGLSPKRNCLALRYEGGFPVVWVESEAIRPRPQPFPLPLLSVPGATESEDRFQLSSGTVLDPARCRGHVFLFWRSDELEAKERVLQVNWMPKGDPFGQVRPVSEEKTQVTLRVPGKLVARVPAPPSF